MLASILAFFGNYRVVYIFTILVIILGIAAIYMQKQHIRALNAENVQLFDQNQQLKDDLLQMYENYKRLDAIRQLDSQVIMSLHDIIHKNSVQHDENREKQVKLEKRSPKTTSYLNISTDPELKLLLDQEDGVYFH